MEPEPYFFFPGIRRTVGPGFPIQTEPEQWILKKREVSFRSSREFESEPDECDLTKVPRTILLEPYGAAEPDGMLHGGGSANLHLSEPFFLAEFQRFAEKAGAYSLSSIGGKDEEPAQNSGPMIFGLDPTGPDNLPLLFGNQKPIPRSPVGLGQAFQILGRISGLILREFLLKDVRHKTNDLRGVPWERGTDGHFLVVTPASDSITDPLREFQYAIPGIP